MYDRKKPRKRMPQLSWYLRPIGILSLTAVGILLTLSYFSPQALRFFSCCQGSEGSDDGDLSTTNVEKSAHVVNVPASYPALRKSDKTAMSSPEADFLISSKLGKATKEKTRLGKQARRNDRQQITVATTNVEGSRPQNNHATMVSHNVLPKGWVYRGSEYKRCRVQTIGCFAPAVDTRVRKKFFIAETSQNMTDWYCISLCGSDKFATYAGLRNGNECLCVTTKVDTLISLEESDQCNAPCSGDNSLNCGGMNGLTMVYRVSGSCVNSPPPSHAVTAGSILGCHKMPDNLHLQMESYNIPGAHLAGRCILRCEKHGLTLAVPVQPHTCLCGHTTASFNLQQPVNASLCSSDTNLHVRVYRTWSEDRRCGDRRFLKEEGQSRSIALGTFPGSGNTWLRHLIESATGIFTGSIYRDGRLIQGGFIGGLLPRSSKKMLVFKTHSPYDFTEKGAFDAGINVYRSPYDTFMSEYNRQHAHSHTKAVSPEEFDSAELERMINSFVKRWRRTTENAIKSKMPKMVFSYDSLVKDPIYWSEQMARFILGKSLDEADLQSRLLCLRLATTGEFKRIKRPLNFDPYTEADKKKINREIEGLYNTMDEYGYSPKEDFRRY